ncbi:hypothetical protein EBZ37_13910, partial [bacterium]|nr:hypothetical protein [bacterium]
MPGARFMKPMRKREIRFIVAQILVLVCFSVAFVSCGGGGKAKAKKQEGSPVPEKMGTPGINESLNSLNSANNTNGNVIHPANISLGEMN